MNKLKIGDVVSWKGSFGSDAPEDVVIEGIEITNGGKYGQPVNEVEWSMVRGRNLTFDLDNGHWAYASQITKK